MPNLWLDTETFCETPIKWGTYRYAEKVEVMLLQWAIDDGPVSVWDATFGNPLPEAVWDALLDPSVLIWFQNGDKFDWPVLACALPEIAQAVPIERRRDTMVQAYCHSLPGNLEMMCAALGVEDDKAKSKEGKRLIRLFCMPQKSAPLLRGITLLDDGSWRATRTSHPQEWEEFKAYAVQDIVAMRECNRRMPTWNYKGKQLDLWFLDQRMNARGMQMDVELAEAAVRASSIAKKQLAVQTRELTHEGVQSATQRDNMLAWILEAYGVDLPDMTAATLERRIKDDDLPEELRELLRVRLQSTTTSVAKYTTLLNGVNSDGRLRGCMQYRGAMRTGRVAHRMFQPGNMPRPDMPTDEIMWAIELLKLDAAQLVFDNVMRVCSNAIRSSIIAGPGKKLVIADLANIEGRVAAWLAGEAWKLAAYRAYDAGTGPDLYVVAYATSFNADPATVGKGPKRQIGKVQELMFQYQGGVGAWITGAATYGIDLAQMTEQVWDTLPTWAKDEAEQFLQWLYEDALNAYARAVKRANEKVELLIYSAEDAMVELDAAAIQRDARCKKKRFGLTEKTFIACDAIKRLWRKANPQISSYWKEIEVAIEIALGEKGKQLQCRMLKIRCDGAWLRVGLPSGRVLCYPQPMWDAQVKRADGTVKSYPGFSYMGIDAYTKKWQRISSYGGKVFENVVQAAACDALLETGESIEAAGFQPVMSVHDEWLCEAPGDRDDLSAARLSDLMCAENEWNVGLPLAAAGFETRRYYKEQ